MRSDILKNIVSFILLVFLANPSMASIVQDTMVVGIHEDPPFIIKNEKGSYEGLSVELWEHIAGQMKQYFLICQISFQLISYINRQKGRKNLQDSQVLCIKAVCFLTINT